MNPVPINLKVDPVQRVIERLGGPRRAQLVGLGVVIVLLIFSLSRWAAAPTWVPLYSGLPLETTNAVTESLNEAGIRYRLEVGGTEVQVPSSELARARVVLAGAGLPSGGRPGLELFDQPSWAMTDFTQRVNYRRALEGELERTISKMRGIESAKVHLAMHESSSIRRLNTPIEASVVLQLRAGQTPSPDVVQGIAHLVAGSVDGLSSENVTIVDGSGRLLSMPGEAGSTVALNNRQLAVQRELESYLETKAEEIVAGIVGPGNVRVQVSASVNFDRLERTVQSVDPDQQAITSEQRSEIIPGPEGGAGSVNQSATYETTRSVEVFSGATGTVRRLSVAVLVNDREIVDENGATQYEARSEAEMARIEALVRSAVGIDESRGDAISVVSMPFNRIEPAAGTGAGMELLAMAERFQRPIIAIVGLLLAFVVALKLIRLIGPSPAPVGVLQAGSDTAALAPPESVYGQLESLEDESRTDVASLRDLAMTPVLEQPEVAARLVRGWLKEG